MDDPLSHLSTILTVVSLIGSAALKAHQNKDKCMDLARRVRNLGDGLPNYAMAAGNNMATVHGLERLRDALNEALTVINSCQESCILSRIFSSAKADDLDKVDMKINSCLLDLNFFSLAHGSVPAQTYDYGSYYQAQGGASGACLGFPTPQHPAVNVQWIPAPAPYPAAPAPYPAAPAPSGSDLSTFYTLPTFNKFFDRMFR